MIFSRTLGRIAFPAILAVTGLILLVAPAQAQDFKVCHEICVAGPPGLSLGGTIPFSIILRGDVDGCFTATPICAGATAPLIAPTACPGVMTAVAAAINASPVCAAAGIFAGTTVPAGVALNIQNSPPGYIAFDVCLGDTGGGPILPVCPVGVKDVDGGAGVMSVGPAAPKDKTPIPTLSPLGLAFLLAGLSGAGMYLIRRRRVR